MTHKERRRARRQYRVTDGARYDMARDVAARECYLYYVPQSPAQTVNAEDLDWTLVQKSFGNDIKSLRKTTEE